MRLILFKNTLFLTLTLLISCANTGGDKTAFAKAESKQPTTSNVVVIDSSITVGANRTELYLPLLVNKNVGVVTNKSGLIFTETLHTEAQSTHLVDSLLSMGVTIKKVFSPEHGFRGNVDAGEKVKDGKDPKTGLNIISLYGKNKKPTAQQLEGVDVLLFDIQDVGVRFYTYISTLTYVMEAAAESGIPVIVLDRPNPNAHYIDGPTLEKEHTSFLGMHEIPLVYGMTIGEYAKMVNGEGWLKDKVTVDLTVIPLKNWSYQKKYALPTRPSPNLPNDKSINLYPSLGFFEGTTVNAGRGTEMQFQIFGAPDFPKEHFSFLYTPQPNFGSKSPKHKGVTCNGKDLRDEAYMNTVNLEWLIEAYAASSKKDAFFKTASFTLHAGSTQLQQDIEAGYTFKEIKRKWLPGIERFKKIRSKYLMYE
ncbi:exo-beta-N-acetylmuramidase NamZ domain-containing protein [Dokdonia sp. Asnod2-E02]|uniref:exo-beta-N-acetylmuramidase NamZ family protein n=1 Tax=Dokdonia sp. Asnod2-E02 TaxID=3160574 RepID=UPI0038637877